MNIELFLIDQNASLREALAKIEANKHGIVFVTNDSMQVIGVATDGDIRRQLLEGLNLDSQILRCANKNFTWANENSTREKLLKQLDSRIRVIPILREDKTLFSFVSRDELPFQEEEKVYARARSPVRISFGGGGSDLTHYFSDDRGAVINTTISLYSHATLRVREDKRILIRSKDIGASIEFEDLDSAVVFEDKFRLIQAVIKVAKPDYGFELFIYSDFPMNSGLGGSAVVSSAILGCFNQFRRDKWDHHEIAELAFQAERLYLGISGGWQDQYATVFGGFNFMEFQLEQNIVHPLRIARDTMIELEECLLLCDTKTTHDSGNIHDDQRVQMQKEDVKRKVFENVELTYEMRNHLLRGRLFQFGKCLHKAWEIKRGLGKKITNSTLDSIYYGARENGAIGGKLLGAGGGGFFLFYVPPFAKNDLMDWVEKQGLGYKPFRFDSEGLQAWTVREIKNHEDMKG
ncbi:CBS domain-containing protein [Leptospira sp. 201903070]|uniref:CBS domain-containing protein n=1 Tax=Leptospira ainlahdjerensis TaxID=2810033 RepID=A0ABS2UAD6_9LEPT|nr:CBS domain-containing protein [Leptospira ainlahdjerensis]MBM9577321.1 CBS domain-containing protein [Leptospira ainlahdjerensis]